MIQIGHSGLPKVSTCVVNHRCYMCPITHTFLLQPSLIWLPSKCRIPAYTKITTASLVWEWNKAGCHSPELSSNHCICRFMMWVECSSPCVWEPSGNSCWGIPPPPLDRISAHDPTEHKIAVHNENNKYNKNDVSIRTDKRSVKWCNKALSCVSSLGKWEVMTSCFFAEKQRKPEGNRFYKNPVLCL